MIPLPFEEAIVWARARGVELPETYYGELKGLARAQAFSIAGITSTAQLQSVLDSLNEATANGESYGAWRKRVESGEIDLELPAHRLETIFRTNIQGAYGRGRCEQQKRVAEDFPYLLYDAVNDSRTRPDHAAMDGFVARQDDPVWAVWRPPAGYNCRCRTIALTARQASRYQEADANAQTQPDAAAARSRALTNGPDAGWDYDLCSEPTKGVDKAKADQAAQAHADLVRAGQEAHEREFGPDNLWNSHSAATMALVQERGAARLAELVPGLDRALEDARDPWAAPSVKRAQKRLDKIQEKLGAITSGLPDPKDVAEYTAARAARDKAMKKAQDAAVTAAGKLLSGLKKKQRERIKRLRLRTPAEYAKAIGRTASIAIENLRGIRRGLPAAEKKWLLNTVKEFSEVFGTETSIVELLRVEGADRAFAKPWQGMVNIGDSFGRDAKVTVWHELGHLVEHERQAMGKSRDWLESLATSKVPEKLADLVPGASYGPAEVALPGRFSNPYVGRVYDGSPYTEVVSMGAQAFASQPQLAYLLTYYPEHVQYTLGLMPL